MEYTKEQINVINLRNKSLLNALFEIEKRPFLWLSEPDILCLKSFINGWIEGRNDKLDENFLADFDLFILNKFGEGESTLGWCNIIIKHCGKEKSLSSFFEAFNDYVESSKCR